MAFPLLAAAGLGGIIGGGILAGNAADIARKRLEDVANTPGIDIDAETLNALLTMQKYLPQATGIGRNLNDYFGTELERGLERGQPGYANRRERVLSNIDEWLMGKLSPEMVSEVYRNTAGRAVGGGYSGAPMQFSRTARDLGLKSFGLQQYATGLMPSLSSMFPSANPVDISGILGLTPTQLINLRSLERAQKMNIMGQQATMPGQTGVWANTLTNMGGMMFGAGMMGGGGAGGSSGSSGGGSAGFNWGGIGATIGDMVKGGGAGGKWGGPNFG